MKPEQAFYQLLKPHLPGLAERIENAAGAGTPDFHCIFEGLTYWVEAKAPKTKTFDLVKLLEPSQIAWTARYLMHGGKIFFVVRCRDEISLFDEKKNIVMAMVKPFEWVTFTSTIKLQLMLNNV